MTSNYDYISVHARRADKVGKVLRIVTLAPAMALVFLTAMLFAPVPMFRNAADYIFAVVFLTVLPLLAYPLHAVSPSLAQGGRETQRNLAILMAVGGYVLGILYALLTSAPVLLAYVFSVYLLSGVLIFAFNKLLHVRASGHACGVAGPLFMLLYFVGAKAIPGFLFLGAVYWCSLRLKRHTVTQLLWGTLIPLFAALSMALLLL